MSTTPNRQAATPRPSIGVARWRPAAISQAATNALVQPYEADVSGFGRARGLVGGERAKAHAQNPEHAEVCEQASRRTPALGISPPHHKKGDHQSRERPAHNRQGGRPELVGQRPADHRIEGETGRHQGKQQEVHGGPGVLASTFVAGLTSSLLIVAAPRRVSRAGTSRLRVHFLLESFAHAEQGQSQA
jgi:hypothetical protein